MTAPLPHERAALADLLAEAGFVAAQEEADELVVAAAGDGPCLEGMVRRRLTGEPLAWITGRVDFCGLVLRVDPGVYVPRWHSEVLARRAADRLPPTGTAVDLCTGSGAIAAALAAHRPEARIIGTDLDERAVACARANGVEAHRGDLFEPVPGDLEGRVDVVVGVVPYVPTAQLGSLQRDTLTFESATAYDGGPDGAGILRLAVGGSARFLRPGGALLLELGGDHAELIDTDLARHGFEDVAVLLDDDGDVRGIEATRAGGSGPADGLPGAGS
ncbi:MAG: HemK family protein methyltransferase [Acidimicrobiia bacterium]|nr:HemK family protein methyltransferase [Acidimicrobiia bacterium]